MHHLNRIYGFMFTLFNLFYVFLLDYLGKIHLQEMRVVL